jgi:hypothetical protein
MADHWVTDDDVADTLAAALTLGGKADLKPFWFKLATVAHDESYHEIVRFFVAQGYTLAQLDTWSERRDFERAITVYRCLTSPTFRGEVTEDTVTRWHRDLASVLTLLDDAGAVLEPPEGELTGEVLTGDLSTDRDIFQVDPRNPNPWEPGYQYRG